MQVKQAKTSQRDELGIQLKKLTPNISLSDKLAFLEQATIKKSSLSDYLRGHVSNIDVAMDMLLFFRKRIAEREKLINAEM